MSLRERKIEKDIKARQNVEKKMAAEEQKRKEAEEYRRKEKERRASLTPQERKEEDKKRRIRRLVTALVVLALIVGFGVYVHFDIEKMEKEEAQDAKVEKVMLDNASKDLRNYCREVYGGESGKPMGALPYGNYISSLGFRSANTIEMRLQIDYRTDKDMAEYAADNFIRLVGCDYKPKDDRITLGRIEVTDGVGTYMTSMPFRECPTGK